jgi:hypothetical protein
MKIFAVYRNPACDWHGALVIAADTKEEAIEIFKKEEYWDDGDGIPVVDELPFERGILYNDELR